MTYCLKINNVPSAFLYYRLKLKLAEKLCLKFSVFHFVCFSFFLLLLFLLPYIIIAYIGVSYIYVLGQISGSLNYQKLYIKVSTFNYGERKGVIYKKVFGSIFIVSIGDIVSER